MPQYLLIIYAALSSAVAQHILPSYKECSGTANRLPSLRVGKTGEEVALIGSSDKACPVLNYYILTQGHVCADLS